MGIMVYTLLWVMQDVYHQPYGWRVSFFWVLEELPRYRPLVSEAVSPQLVIDFTLKPHHINIPQNPIRTITAPVRWEQEKKPKSHEGLKQSIRSLGHHRLLHSQPLYAGTLKAL